MKLMNIAIRNIGYALIMIIAPVTMVDSNGIVICEGIYFFDAYSSHSI